MALERHHLAFVLLFSEILPASTRMWHRKLNERLPLHSLSFPLVVGGSDQLSGLFVARRAAYVQPRTTVVENSTCSERVRQEASSQAGQRQRTPICQVCMYSFGVGFLTPWDWCRQIGCFKSRVPVHLLVDDQANSDPKSGDEMYSAYVGPSC